MPGAFDAGSIYGKLTLDLSDWTANLEKAKKDSTTFTSLIVDHKEQIEKVGKAVSVVGAAIVGALGLAMKSAMDYTLEIGRMAVKTGMATETISGLAETAEKSGITLDDLGAALRRFSSLIVDAKNGNEAANKTLKQLGINTTDASGALRPMDALLMDAADRFKKMENGTEKAALAVDLFGRSGTSMISFLNKGSEGIKEFTEEQRRMGTMITAEGVEKAKAMRFSMQDVKQAVLGLQLAIANAVMPVFKAMTDTIGFIIQKVQQLYNLFPPLGNAITLVVGTFGALAAVVGPLLLVITKFLSIKQQLAALAPVLSSRLASLGTSIKSISGILFAATLAIEATTFAFRKLHEAQDRAIGKIVESADQIGKGWQFARDSIAGSTSIAGEEVRKFIDKQRELGKNAEEIGQMLFNTYRGKIADSVKAAAKDTAEMASKVAEAQAELTDRMKAATLNEYDYRIYQSQKWAEDLKAKFKDSVNAASMAAQADKIVALEMAKIRKEQADAIAKAYEQAYERILKKSAQLASGEDKNSSQYFQKEKILTNTRIAMGTNLYSQLAKSSSEMTSSITVDLSQQGNKYKNTFADIAGAVSTYIQVMQQGFGQFFSALSGLSKQRYENEMNRMESEYEKQRSTIEKSLLSEEEKDMQLKALDEKFEKDKMELKRRQLESEKKASIIQAILNMATAITASWKLGFPMGVIAAAIAAAACAIQIKTIKAQQVALAEGGVVDKPTNALIGEAAPEAVIPLEKLGDMLGIRRGAQRAFQAIFNIYAMDAAGVEAVTRSKIAPELRRMMKNETFTIPPNAVR